MDLSTLFLLIAIGMTAGILSGFIGVGGGIIIVPGLIYYLGMSQNLAQGKSLALMIPPIGILAVYNYYRTGDINLASGVIATTFVVGGFIGSKLSLKLSANTVRSIFGVVMLYTPIKLIGSSYRPVFKKLF